MGILHELQLQAHHPTHSPLLRLTEDQTHGVAVTTTVEPHLAVIMGIQAATITLDMDMDITVGMEVGVAVMAVVVVIPLVVVTQEVAEAEEAEEVVTLEVVAARSSPTVCLDPMHTKCERR